MFLIVLQDDRLFTSITIRIVFCWNCHLLGQNGNEGSLADTCATGNYQFLTAADDARQVANYLWNNFLGGQSDSRPLLGWGRQF
ncbi:hypothetical protein M9H77_26564 [Catharanthus roseus]|uniref:Uncharacterized protein n=1 Tax=Catharanthus roseus TaxID=4058 RepID=A0ACC0AB10_CATRO|nr:hypothetical protein M9H77_26564 [Catharanthus roseus]